MPWRLPLRQVLPANVSRLRRANVRGACTNLRHPGLGSPASPSRYFCLVFRLRRLAMNCATPTAIISSKKTKSQIMLLLSTFFSFRENIPQPGRRNACRGAQRVWHPRLQPQGRVFPARAGTGAAARFCAPGE